jgi:hypothetical protein
MPLFLVSLPVDGKIANNQINHSPRHVVVELAGHFNKGL